MTQQAELLKTIDTLSPKYLGEVIDFAAYLEQKNSVSVTPLAETPKTDISLLSLKGSCKGSDSAAAIEQCSGIFKRLGINLSSDDFLAVRRQDKALEEQLDSVGK